MDVKHLKNSMCKIVKSWCITCLFCAKKYPIPVCVVFLFFLSYIFFPRVYTFLIYSSPLVGFSFLAHRILLGVDRPKIKQVEQDDRRKKFAKSRRSFKAVNVDRSHLVRRNAKEKSSDYTSTNSGDIDAIFSKSLNDLLFETTALIDGRPKETREVSFESIIGRGECSSSYSSPSLRPETYDRLDGKYQKYGNVNGDDNHTLEGESSDTSGDEGHEEPHDKAVQWIEDDQKNVMDLGLLETERNKRLESLIERRRSRKNLLDFDDRGAIGNMNKTQIPAVKITKTNPFLEDNSGGKNTPGSAPSLLETRNPFDLPYDPHEEKPDLSGDNFHEDFAIVHHKEPIYCRHASFSYGAFSHPETRHQEIRHDKHEMPFFKDLVPKPKPLAGSKNSTVDKGGECKNIQQDSLISDDSINDKEEEEEPERKSKEVDGSNDVEQSELQRNNDSYDCGPSTMFEDRKADVCFFYGKGGHGPSNSIVSDLQVEVSDGESYLDDLDVEKEKLKGSCLNSSNLSEVDTGVVKADGEEDDTNHHVASEISSADQSGNMTD